MRAVVHADDDAEPRVPMAGETLAKNNQRPSTPQDADERMHACLFRSWLPGWPTNSHACACDDERLEMISAGDHGNDRRKFEPAAAGNKALQAAAVASRHWSASTESRIVRVSRVFGGKDRHSKDRLGLSQPSKVVDWLLNAAQHEIDKLPPLHFPPHDDDLLLSAHHHHHLQSPASMAMVPPFSHATAATASMMVADGGKATQSAHDGAGDLKGFMSLSNSRPGERRRSRHAVAGRGPKLGPTTTTTPLMRLGAMAAAMSSKSSWAAIALRRSSRCCPWPRCLSSSSTRRRTASP
ncbi:hypothetical protein ZWY2020_005650 [Hordeum vulgare]|nr:hypothetical protein ZWY2020_005650 [Hordeum vulgare]